MKKIIKKRIYPVMLSATLLASLMGCGKEEKITTEEITTEANVSEDTELAISDEELTLNNMAEKTYTEYKKFYDALSITKEQVNIMVKVYNGYYDGYSQDQIDDALANINRILLSDNVKQLLDNVNTRKYDGEAPISADSDIVEEMTVLPNPLIEDFSLNSEDQEIIINYENLRDELVNDIKNTGTYSDSMVQKINNAVIEQEKNGYISESYAAVCAQWQLCNLCQFVNPTSAVIKDSDDNEYQLAFKGYMNDEGYIESDIENEYYTLIELNTPVPNSILSKFNKISEKVIFTKYSNKLKELEDSIKVNAISTIDTNEISEEENKNITQSTYEKYEDYYNSISVSEEDISIMVDVINGDVTSYSKDEIEKANDLAMQILFPEKMQNAINDCNAKKEVSFSSTNANIPKVSDMLVLNDEFKNNLIAYENLRDEVAQELANTGTYSDSIVQEINTAVIDQETRKFDEYVDYLESSVNNEGHMSILIAADLQQCNLCKSVNPNISFIKGINDDYEYQIAPSKDENEYGFIEKKVVDEYNEQKNAGKEISDDTLENYAITKSKLISTKYEEQYNEWTNYLLIKAGYTDTSMLELQKQKKSLLEQKKFYMELENELAMNSNLKDYNLTFSM